MKIKLLVIKCVKVGGCDIPYQEKCQKFGPTRLSIGSFMVKALSRVYGLVKVEFSREGNLAGPGGGFVH